MGCVRGVQLAAHLHGLIALVWVVCSSSQRRKGRSAHGRGAAARGPMLAGRGAPDLPTGHSTEHCTQQPQPTRGTSAGQLASHACT